MKASLLKHYAENGKTVQLKLKDGSPAPVGPGKLEVVNVAAPTGAGGTLTHEYFKFTAPAQLGNTVFFLPIIFDADDVIWLTEGPVNEKGEPVVIEPPAPQQQGRSRGGLHIPPGH